MCGNWISNPIGSAKKVISDPIGWGEKHLGDIASAAAIAMGQPELIPLTEGFGNAASTKLQGGSWGDALKSGVTSGALSYAGGQAMSGLSNLASNAFPETMQSISSGLGQAKGALGFGSPAAADAGLQQGFGDLASGAGNAGTFSMGGAGAPTLDTSGLDQLASSASDMVGDGAGSAAGSAATEAAKKGFTPWWTAQGLGVDNVPVLKQVADFTGNHPYMTLGTGGLALAANASANNAKKQQQAAAAAKAAQTAKDASLNDTWQAMLRQQPLQRSLSPSNANVDYAHYGQGPEHLFYDDVNPPYSVPVQIGQSVPNNMALPLSMKRGGPVRVPISPPVFKGPVKANNPKQIGGQADKIPANLSQDEHVIPADVVAHLGDGSSDAGHDMLQKLVTAVRAHKASAGTKLPPPAKTPTKYMGSK